MIYLNENVQQKLPLNKKNVYIVSDFDRTLTHGNSMTSWSILANKNLLPKGYIQERQKYYEIYRPIEIDNSISYEIKQIKMKEWYIKHINLFIKYNLKETLIKEASKDINIMSFRPGVKDFLNILKKNNIPLIIISAGIGNFIKSFLENNGCNFDNIYIISNMLKFKDGVTVGVDKNIIHSLNKNEATIPLNIKENLKNRNNIILLGDQISDIKMVEEKKRNNTIRVAFLTEDTKNSIEDYKKYFDVICTNEESYITLEEQLLEK